MQFQFFFFFFASDMRKQQFQEKFHREETFPFCVRSVIKRLYEREYREVTNFSSLNGLRHFFISAMQTQMKRNRSQSHKRSYLVFCSYSKLSLMSVLPFTQLRLDTHTHSIEPSKQTIAFISVTFRFRAAVETVIKLVG